MAVVKLCLIELMLLVFLILLQPNQLNGKDVLKVKPKLKAIKLSKLPVVAKIKIVPVIKKLKLIKKLPIFKKKIPVLIFLKLLALKKTVLFGPPVGIGAYVLGSGAGLAVNKFDWINYLYRSFFRQSYPLGWGWRGGWNQKQQQQLRLTPPARDIQDYWKQNVTDSDSAFPGLVAKDAEEYLAHHFDKYLIDNPNEHQVAGLVKLLRRAYLQTLSDLDIGNGTVPDFIPLPLSYGSGTDLLRKIPDFIPLPLPSAENGSVVNYVNVPLLFDENGTVSDYISLPLLPLENRNETVSSEFTSDGSDSTAKNDEAPPLQDKVISDENDEALPTNDEELPVEDEAVPTEEEEEALPYEDGTFSNAVGAIPNFIPLPTTKQNGSVPDFIPFPTTDAEENLVEDDTKNMNIHQREFPNYDLLKEIDQLFVLLSTFDTGTCFEMLICDIHSRGNGNSKTLSSYEGNVISMFRMINSTFTENTALNRISEKYVKAAKFGGNGHSSSTSCQQEYRQCKYSAKQLIKMGMDLENSSTFNISNYLKKTDLVSDLKYI